LFARLPVPPVTSVPEKSHRELFMFYSVQRFGAVWKIGAQLSLSLISVEKVTWCLAPTVSAPPGGKRLAGKIICSHFTEYGLEFRGISRS